MLGRVVQQVAEDLPQPVGVPWNGGELLLAVGMVHGNPLRGQKLMVGVNRVLQFRLNIHGLHGQGETAVLNPGKLQQFLHHARQAAGLAGDDPHALSDIPLIPGFAAHNGLRPAGDGGQGRAQLVGYRGDKLRLHAFGLFDPQGHVVDGVGEIAHLIVKLFLHLDAITPPGNPPGDAGDVFHRVHNGADKVNVGNIDQNEDTHRQDHRHQSHHQHLAVHQPHGGDIAHDPHQLPIVQQRGGDRGDPLAGLAGDPLPGGHLLVALHLGDVPGPRHGP